MIDAITLSDILKSLPTATSYSGKSVLTVDATGAMSKMSYSMLVDALHATGKAMMVYTIPLNTPLDANELTQENTIYRLVCDLNAWDKDNQFDNFPARPSGGFTLIVLKETAYLRQIYMLYGTNTVYMRYRAYANGGTSWQPWQKIIPEPV